MGKLINMFSAFLGLGLAAGAAFYIYRTRKCSGERENDNTEERVILVSEITRQSHKQSALKNKKKKRRTRFNFMQLRSRVGERIMQQVAIGCDRFFSLSFLRCVCYKFPNMYSRVICKLVINDILMSFFTL